MIKLWKSISISFEGNSVVLKTVDLSKIIFQASMITHPNHVTKELQKILEEFLCGTLIPTTKHDIAYDVYKHRDLKNINVP